MLYYTIYEINKIIQTNLSDIQEYNKRLIQLYNKNIVIKLSGSNSVAYNDLNVT